MKQQTLISLLILLFVASFATATDLPYKEGELLVRFAEVGGQPPSQQTKIIILNSILPGCCVEKEYNIVPGLSLVKLPDGTTVEDVLSSFNQSSAVLYAEPNYRRKLAVIPNDPRFGELWGMHNTGQAGGTVDADIDAPEAWDIGTGDASIVVAVTDSGVDYTHPDLAANMWINPGEIPGNGIDDDGNGYIDDIYGYDFGDDDGDPMDDSIFPGHGTHVAGTIGAVGNNNEGVAGVCWDVSLMAVKIPGANGIWWTDSCISAIQYATYNGANVINASWGDIFPGLPPIQAEYDAIEAAGDAGILFVAAATNEDNDNDAIPIYPSCHDLDNIISVMATDHDDVRSIWWPGIIASNYGATTVDLGAPGSDILSTWVGGVYLSNSGTSMAAPHVAGACALIWSFEPSLGHMEVKNIILSATDPLVALEGLCVTEGRLNIETALRMLNTRVLNKNTGIEYRRIQKAIDDPLTLNGHELIADADNWYFETIDFHGKEVILRSGDVDNPADATVSPENTYISGRAEKVSVVTFKNGEGANAVLKGFTITEGQASGTASFEKCGGGIYIENSSPTITDCEINGNRADFSGGGIYCDNGSEPTITNCNISNNTADYWGGGIYCYNSSPVIKSCLIVNNSVDSWDGGGIYLENSSPELLNCTIVGNSASDNGGIGGGLCCYDLSEPLIRDCIFSGNEHYAIAIYEDGYEYYGTPEPRVTYCLFYENSDGDYCIYDDSGASPVITVYTGAGEINGISVKIHDNIDGDPMFVRGRLGTYYLSNYQAGQRLDRNGEPVDPLVNPEDADSPAVNAGSGDASDPDIGMDIYSTRTDNVADSGTVDIGYHYKDPLPAVDYQLYTYVVPVGGGSISPSGITSHPPYSHVALTATAGSNWRFKSWSGTDDDSLIETDPDGKVLPVQHNVVTMDLNKTVRVEFETDKIQLITSVTGESGTISPSTHRPRFYDRGTVVKLTAKPDNPSHVVIWHGTDDDYSTSLTNTVTMVEPFTTSPQGNDCKEVEAEFYAPLTLYVPGDYTSIQRAISAAHDRDIIMVAPGTYLRDAPRLQINNKAITLTSSNPDDPNVVASTILENGIEILNCGRNTIINGFFLDSVAYTTGDGLNGDAFDFTDDGSNGGPGAGGGIRLHVYYTYPEPPAQGSSPDIRNCIFYQCGAFGGNGGDGGGPTGVGDGGWGGWAHGGGASIGADSSPKFTNCQFIDCFTIGGNGGNADTDDPPGGRGGLYDQQEIGYGGWYWGPYEDYRKYSGYGGAVYCDVDSTPEFVDCSFVGSSAAGGCSGVGDGMPPSSHWKIDRFGGAVYAAAGSSPVFRNCVFEDSEADITAPLTDHHEPPEPTATDDPFIAYGGAVAFEAGATPTFENCTFSGNLACIGGGMYWSWTEPLIYDCNFVDNSAFHGGGVLFVGGTAKIAGSDFSGNDANNVVGEGGAICCLGANAEITDCGISDNDANGSGGGIYISNKDISGTEVSGDNTVLVKNCLITENSAGRDGGGISANWHSEPNIVNCTIVNNWVTGEGFEYGYGGGLYCGYGNYTNIINSIIWGNTADNGAQLAIATGDEHDPRPSTVRVTYSDVQGGAAYISAPATGGDTWVDTGCTLDWDEDTGGNLPGGSNALFVWGYYLSQIAAGQESDSPCVDAGFGDASLLPCGPYWYTTRTDNGDDVSEIDIGYHYKKFGKFTTGDVDFNAKIDIDDVYVLMSHWLEECGPPCWCAGCDLNQDGIVNFVDMAILTALFGTGDIEAPVPNPSTWSVAPTSAGPSSIAMATTPAVDNSGQPVYYYFECITDNSFDSGWQVGPGYTATGLTLGAQYAFRVRAADHKLLTDPDYLDDPDYQEDPDTYLSDPSNLIDLGSLPDSEQLKIVTRWSLVGYALTGAPAAPSNLVATAVSDSQIDLTWTDNAEGESGFKIERRTGTGSFVQIAVVGANVTSYSDTGLLALTTYTYRVCAYSGEINSAFSNTASATTLEPGVVVVDTEPPVTDAAAADPYKSTFLATAPAGVTGAPPTGMPYEYVGTDGMYHHTMTATVAVDALSPPVEYYFYCSSRGDASSGWQLSPTYDVMVGSFPHNWIWQVKTRDSAVPVPNEGNFSDYWRIDGATYPYP